MSNSIGDLKNSGLQGNNFPWQLKMLLGQQCACDQLTEIAGNTDDLEFLLTAILTTLQNGTEYEAKFVLETCPGAPPTTRILLEVRVWDTATSTWGPITYYLPGSSTPEPGPIPAPGCTLEYGDPSGVLAMIYNELQTQTGILTDIEADTTSIDVTLTNLFAAYSAGQQACASSLSVTLCTEQGINLSNIDTSTSNALTELLAQGITLDSIETLITTLNSIVSTEATLQSVLTELQAINIDTDGLSQEATQLLVLAALNTVISNTTGLATEVTLNALLTAFNAEDFATETTLALVNSNTVLGNITLNNLLTAFNAEDFATETTLAALNLWVQGNAATEVTLQSVLTELQGINLDTNGLSQETTQLLVLAALNNILVDTTAILADTANLDVPLSTLATEVTLQSVLTAINNIATSGLATETTLLALLNAFNAEDFATETTLALIQAITSQMTFTGGDLNVSANIQVGGTDVSNANPVPISDAGGSITVDGTVNVGNFPASIEVSNDIGNPLPVTLPSGVQASRYVRTVGVGPVNILAGATSVSILNSGGNNITVDTGLGPEIVEPGISIGWRAREGRTLGAFTIAGSTGASEFVYTAVI